MSIVDFWSKCSLAKPSFVHPDDEQFLQDVPKIEGMNFDRFVRSQDYKDCGSKLHLSLIPLPYSGSLRKADIFILMLNPGFKPIDYYAEERDLEFRQRRIANLRQEHDGAHFPLMSLDPKFSWASMYFSNKFKDIATKLMGRPENKTYQDALQLLANRIAIIQRIPYHSSTAPGKALRERLPSSIEAKKYVEQTLVQRAKAGEILVVAARGDWDLPKSRNVVLYQGTERRGAHFTRKSPGGRRILSWLKEPTEFRR